MTLTIAYAVLGVWVTQTHFGPREGNLPVSGPDGPPPAWVVRATGDSAGRIDSLTVRGGQEPIETAKQLVTPSVRPNRRLNALMQEFRDIRTTERKNGRGLATSITYELDGALPQEVVVTLIDVARTSGFTTVVAVPTEHDKR